MNLVFGGTGFLVGAFAASVAFLAARRRTGPQAPSSMPVLDPSDDAMLDVLARDWTERRNAPEASPIAKECMRELLLFSRRQAISGRRFRRV